MAIATVGAVASGTATSTGSPGSFQFAVALPVGTIIVAVVAFDNATTTTPTLNGAGAGTLISNSRLSLVGIRHVDSPQAGANAGVRIAVAVWRVVSAANANESAILSWSTTPAAKAWEVRAFSGVPGTPTIIDQAVANGTGSGARTATLTAAPSGGNLVIGVVGTESNAAPSLTTGGYTAMGVGAASSGGGAASNAGVRGYWAEAASGAPNAASGTVSDGGVTVVEIGAPPVVLENPGQFGMIPVR